MYFVFLLLLLQTRHNSLRQVLESEMSGEPVKPEVSVEERVERCREKQVGCTLGTSHQYTPTY